MTIQTIEIKGITTGQTLTLLGLFASGSDTPLDSGQALTEIVGKPTHYRFDTADLALSDWHDAVIQDADGAIGTWEVNLTNTATVHYATQDLSGTTVGTVNVLGTQAKADVNAEVLDVLNVDAFAEVGQESPAATTTIRKMLAYLYKAWRNKKEQTSSQYSLYADDASTVDQKATVSDDGTTTTVGEVATGP